MGIPSHEPIKDADEHRPRDVTSGRLVIATILLLASMAIEIPIGLLKESSALLSDGIHNSTHLVSTLTALTAIAIARKYRTPRKTFNYWRLEVVASFVNGLLMLPLVGLIIYHAIMKIVNDVQPDANWVLAAGGIGLVLNLVTVVLLLRPSRTDLNAQSVLLHVAGDALSSVGVVGAGLLVKHTGIHYFDPAIAIIISIVIILWAVRISRQSLNILLEGIPPEIIFKDVEKVFLDHQEIKKVHDLHIWSLTSGLNLLTVHVTLAHDMMTSNTDEIAEEINHELHDRFGISHTCIQFELKSEKDAIEANCPGNSGEKH